MSLEPLQKQEQIVSRFQTEPLNITAQREGSYLEFRSNPSPIIRDLQRAFCGKEWDSKIQAWINTDIGIKPLANDTFLRRVMPIIHSYVNQNTPRGNITAEEAHRIAERASVELIFLIGLEHMKFNIDEENFDAIVNTFDDLIFLTLTRAIEDGERRHDDASFRASETTRGQAVQGQASKNFKIGG